MTLSGTATFDTTVPVVNGRVAESSPTPVSSRAAARASYPSAGRAQHLHRPDPRQRRTLELAKPANVAAVPGDLSIFGGAVGLLDEQQIADAASVSVNNPGHVLTSPATRKPSPPSPSPPAPP